VRAPRALAPYLAFKGSLAVDGVSLTINRVQDVKDGCDVTINLIPHTLAATTLGQLSAGQSVNLEVDSLARYAERIVSLMAPSAGGKRT
jgi:riboflavin synthase